MRSELISKVCDAAVRVADRCEKYMDRRDAEESPGSKREHALVEARGRVKRLTAQSEEMAAEKGEAVKTELEEAKAALSELEGSAVEKDDKEAETQAAASAEDKSEKDDKKK